MSWITTLLSSSWSDTWARVSEHHEWKDNSALAEYPPLNLTILGSCILQNSLDAFAATAAETLAAMVAASFGLPVKGAM